MLPVIIRHPITHSITHMDQSVLVHHPTHRGELLAQARHTPRLKDKTKILED